MDSAARLLETGRYEIWTPYEGAVSGNEYAGFWIWRTPSKSVNTEIAHVYFDGGAGWFHEGRRVAPPAWVAAPEWALRYAEPENYLSPTTSLPPSPPRPRHADEDDYTYHGGATPLNSPVRHVEHDNMPFNEVLVPDGRKRWGILMARLRAGLSEHSHG